MPDLILVLGLGPGVGRGVLSWERSSMLARGASSSSSPASSLAMVTADYSSGHNISNLFTITSTRCCGVGDGTMGSGGTLDTALYTLDPCQCLVCVMGDRTLTLLLVTSRLCALLSPTATGGHSLGHVGHLYTVQTLSTVRCTLYNIATILTAQTIIVTFPGSGLNPLIL